MLEYFVISNLGQEQEMIRFTRTSMKTFDKESFGKFKFVPLLNNKIRN